MSSSMDARNGKWVNVDYTNPRVYNEYDGQHEGSISGSSSISSSQLSTSHSQRYATPLHPTDSEAYFIEINVSEPVKQGEGMNAYISYKLSTETNRPQFTKASFSVIRRYSDFTWLHATLSSMYPGVIVPPLPEKLLVGRFSPEFIESRRRALQLFVHRCCIHPELQHSTYLTTFLEATDEALAAFKVDSRNAGTKGARGVLFQWLDETVSTISTTLGAYSHTNGAHAHVEKTSADHEIEDMMAYVDGLEPIMTGLHKHAHGLTKRAREIADGFFEMGVAYSILGKSEENPSLQQALQAIGNCSDRLSFLAAEHAEKEALQFEEPIMDYIRLVGAVKAALCKRQEVRGLYGAAVVDLETKTVAVTKLLKHKSATEENVQLAERDVMTAQQRVDDAKLEYDIVTERVLREVERFKQEKLEDFKRIILDYIQHQIAYSRKVEDEWSRMIPQLNQIHIDTGSPDTSSMTSDSHGSMMMASALSGTNSFIQEDYIPSSGAPVMTSSGDTVHGRSSSSHFNTNDGGDLSSHLLSLSIDQDEEEV